jgi:hypothetical protein
MRQHDQTGARRALPIATLLATVAFAGAMGCSGEKKDGDKDCVDSPEGTAPIAKSVKVERYGLGRAGDEDKESKDWCRACVMSKLGYASCQRVFAETTGESKDSLRASARKQACADAKFPKGGCPDSAVINIQCKGEPAPAGTPDPGTALQNLYKAMGGGQAGPGAPAAAAAAGEKPAADGDAPEEPTLTTAPE